MLEGTRDKWFRPSDVKVAPDGSLIVADWYDPGVGGHRMGDVERGRLFRIVPKHHPGSYRSPEFNLQTVEGAIAALRSPNKATHYLAWQALRALGEQAESALLQVWEDDPNARMRARALWLLGRLPGRGIHYVDVASRDKDKNIRCQSLRLARQLEDVDVLPVVERLVEDPQASVRRECAIALRHNKAEATALLWARLAKQYHGSDRWYLEALGIAADGQWDRFMQAWMEMVDGQWNTPSGRDLVWRSRASQTATWLGEILADATVPTADLPRYFRALDFVDPEARDEVAAQLAFGVSVGDEQRKALVMLEATRRIQPNKVKQTPKYQQAIHQALDAFDRNLDFVNIIRRFGLQQRVPDLLQIAIQHPHDQLGVEAMRVLCEQNQIDLLRDTIRQAEEGDIEGLIQVLGNTGDNRAVELLQEIVDSAGQTTSARRLAVRALAKSNAGARRLLREIRREQLAADLIDAATASLHMSRSRQIRNEAAQLLPLPPSKTAEPLPPISQLARLRGDAASGRTVFSGVGTCSKCHVVQGQGKEVGPNLSEIGTKLSREALYESILYPSAGISHNYEAYNLVTVDGEVFTGLLTSKTSAEVVVTTDDGIARRYATDDVDELVKQTVSLMPADIQKLMTKQELVDVVEYLTTLRKK